jgi:beta propeller repeat protein
MLNKWERSKKTWIAVATALALIGGTIGTSGNVVRAEASDSYQFADSVTATGLQGTGHVLSGVNMAWVQNDKSGVRQIMLQDLTTGTIKQITSAPSAKSVPAISGNIVAWADKRNYDKLAPMWDVYIYDIRTGKERKASSVQGQLQNVTVDGNDVSYFDLTNNRMFVYDLAADEEKEIGIGSYPVVAKGKILYENKVEGGLMVYDLATAEKRVLAPLTPYETATWKDFNGTAAMWYQSGSGTGCLRMIDAADPSAAPVDLIPNVDSNTFVPKLELGETYGAWIQKVDGVKQIMGVDLQNGKVTHLTDGSTDQNALIMDGDRIVYEDAQHKMVFRSIIRTQAQTSGGSAPASQPQGSQPQSSQPQAQEDITGDEASAVFAEKGGQLALGQDRLALAVPEGAFAGETKVTARWIGQADTASHPLMKGLQPFGGAFRLDWEGDALKPVALTVKFDRSALVPQQVRKLALYRWDENGGKWAFAQGTASYDGELSAKAAKPGLYAVMSYELPFADTKGHWAEGDIGIAASRWIMNGGADNRFHPNDSLTRAEFAKMLVTALGLAPESPEKPTFGDVAALHWSYPYVEAAAKAGIVQGDNGQFRPGDQLSREAMIAMLVRAFDAAGEQAATANALAPFSDANQVAAWAKPLVAVSVAKGWTQGSGGMLRPKATSTRAEAVVLLLRVTDNEQAKE